MKFVFNDIFKYRKEDISKLVLFEMEENEVATNHCITHIESIKNFDNYVLVKHSYFRHDKVFETAIRHEAISRVIFK